MDDLIFQSANKTFPLLSTTKTTCVTTFYPFVQQYGVTSATTAYCKFPRLIDHACKITGAVFISTESLTLSKKQTSLQPSTHLSLKKVTEEGCSPHPQHGLGESHATVYPGAKTHGKTHRLSFLHLQAI